MSEISNAARMPALCDIPDIMASPEEEPLLYRQLMAIKPGNMTPNAWMTSAGVSRNFLGDVRKRGNANQKTLEKMIEAAGLTPAAFWALQAPDAGRQARDDEEHAASLPFRREDEPRDIPVLGSAMGADFSIDDNGAIAFAEVIDLDLNEVVDHLRRPSVLRNRKDVYGVIYVGSSMEPKHEAGDPGYVDPKATPRMMDDVVVYLVKRDDDGEGHIRSVLIKRLRKRTASFVELEQFNPPLVFTVPTSEIAMIHRVIPWKELVSF